MVSRRKLAVSLGVVAIAAITLLTASWAGAQAKAKSYPRSSTLITSGTQWGNIAGTNPYVGNYAAGMVGLCNETLLRYDPLADKYINWLAKSAKFTGSKVYKITIRSGVKWSDGRKFTANDVKYNFMLGRYNTAFWNNLYVNLKSIKVPSVVVKVKVKRHGKVVKVKKRRPGNTVVFTFKGTPNYIQWQNLIWNLPMIAPQQARSQIANAASLVTYSPGNPIGTGPYAMDPAGYDPTTRAVWKKKAVWWAAKQHVAPSPKPTYIIDLCNTNNTNALSGLLTGIEDLNNNYLPGVVGYVNSGQMQTYFPSAPYDLSANTAWLEVNNTHPPLDDKAFRRALAQAIDVNAIVSTDYGNLVLPASPTGLLPMWSKFINAGLVASKGWVTGSASAAKATLDAAGYPKDGSGWYLKKGGGSFDLKIAVPSGWSDWEVARDMICNDLKAAKIHCHADLGDFNHWQSERNLGDFDMIVDNAYQLSDNPWTYWNSIFHLPIIDTGSGQTFANFGRYYNTTAWDAVQKLDKTPPSSSAARKTLNDQLQGILMDDLPIIPLWYNGVWAQTQSQYWTNWPSATSTRKYIPCMWRGYLQMTGIDMFTHVKKA